MRKNLPPIANFLNRAFPELPGYVIKEHVDSGANGHVFRAYSATLEISLACKVVPVANLVTEAEKTQYLAEARRANVLAHPSVIHYMHVFDYLDENSNTQCVIFAGDFVNGPSLERYIKDSKESVDLSFISHFLDTMLSLLIELGARGLQHGDLHAGNILVVKSQYDIEDTVVFKVTDFGVRNFSSPSRWPDDFISIAQILNALLGFIDRRQCSGPDRFVFDAIRDRFVSRYLVETDPTIDARDPSGLLRQFRGLNAEYERAQDDARGDQQLNTPFDYPNCEQIGDSNLLLQALYSDRLLELDKIKAHSNVVLTGPRGCGKTTVFRALSLRYLISTQMDAPEIVDYVGVYYRCDDLYFAFPRYTEISEAATDIPMHFLIVTLLSLLFRDLERWAQRYVYVKREWDQRIAALVGRLWHIFDWNPPTGPNALHLASLTRKLDQERRRSEKTYRFARRPEQNLDGFFGPGVMVRVCRELRSTFSFLKDRSFHFYIDDYSSPKISRELQVNLNRLVMHRNADVFFKVSTESPVSFERRDIDGKKFVEAREFDFINLGVRYITGDWHQTMVFIGDLFIRRFRAVVSYPVSSLRDLLGSCPRNDNARARVARKEAAVAERESYLRLYGEEVISLMCSGDIHHMIRLVARMVDDFGGREELSSHGGPIAPASQDQSIRKEAGAVMESIRTVPEVGPQLANVVAAFGKVAQSYLLHRTSVNKSAAPAHQASKIEPYEALRLSPDAEKILSELLRYSVFIEDPKGKSRRGNVVPRLFLRRSLIPHFSLTFSQRDSIELENEDIELLLTQPIEFEAKHRIRSGRDDGTEDLFDGA